MTEHDGTIYQRSSFPANKRIEECKASSVTSGPALRADQRPSEQTYPGTNDPADQGTTVTSDRA